MKKTCDELYEVTLIYAFLDSEGHEDEQRETGLRDHLGNVYCRNRTGNWTRAIGSLKPDRVIEN